MTDREYYDLLSCCLRDMIARQDWNSHEYRRVWKTIEKLKNEHGGFPPPADKPTTSGPSAAKQEGKA